MSGRKAKAKRRAAVLLAAGRADGYAMSAADRQLARKSQALSIASIELDLETKGRTKSTSDDPQFTWVDAIREAESVLADPELVPWVDELIAATRRVSGRPVELSTRTYLVSAIAWAINGNGEFHLDDLHSAMVNDFPEADRVRLGIARTDRWGQPAALTYTHVYNAHHRLGRAFNAESKNLSEAQRSLNFERRQELIIRTLAPTMPETPYLGGYSIDGTYLPGFYSGPRRFQRIREQATTAAGSRRERAKLQDDGAVWVADYGRKVVVLDPQPAPDEVATVRAQLKAEVAAANEKAEKKHGAKAEKKRVRVYLAFPSLDPDAGWHVRNSSVKWGYNAMTVVRCAPGAPMLIESLVVGAGSSAEWKAGLRAQQDLAAHRAADVELLDLLDGKPILGLSIADRGLTNSRAYWHGVRETGGVLVADFTKKQQANWSVTEFANGDTSWNHLGQNYCRCIPEDLRNQIAPDWRDGKGVAKYRRVVDRREAYRYKPNGQKPTRDTGAWPHFSPHFGSGRVGGPGGCDQCTNPNGSAALGADGKPRERCCTQKTQQLYADDYFYRQSEPHGSAAWAELFGRRNVSEASNQMLKGVHSNFKWQGSLRLRGLVNFTLVSLFFAIATNINMVRTWKADVAKAAADLEKVAAGTADTRKRRGRTKRSDTAQPARKAPPRRVSRPATPTPAAAGATKRRGPKGFDGIYNSS